MNSEMVRSGAFRRMHQTIRVLICGRNLDTFGQAHLDRYPAYGGRPEDEDEVRYRILNNYVVRMLDSDFTVKLRRANGEIK